MDFTITTHSRAVRPQSEFMVGDAVAKTSGAFDYKALSKMGFTVDSAKVAQCMANDAEYKAAVEAFAKDAGFELGDANIDALGQFFMVFNETEINRLYRGRTAIATFGVKTMGDWLTEKIVYKLRELTTANTGSYDDFSRPAYTNYNYGYDTRDTIRLEWGLEVTKREEMVAGVMRRNAYKDKKDAILLTQEIWENNFFWKGVSAGNKKLYGALNEVNLPAAQPLPVDLGAAEITPADVVAVFRKIKQDLATSLKGNGDIESLPVEIAMPIAWQTALTAIDATSVVGYTANKWLAENWKPARVSFKPELDDATADGKPMMLVFAVNVPGVGMDTINLSRTSALRLVGAMPTLKGREEAYSSSVAGALVACPMGIQIWEGPGDSSAA